MIVNPPYYFLELASYRLTKILRAEFPGELPAVAFTLRDFTP